MSKNMWQLALSKRKMPIVIYGREDIEIEDYVREIRKIVNSFDEYTHLY